VGRALGILLIAQDLPGDAEHQARTAFMDAAEFQSVRFAVNHLEIDQQGGHRLPTVCRSSGFL